MLNNYLFYLFLLLTLTYAGLLFRWIIGWIIYPSIKIDQQLPAEIKVTVVVAARNEENEILNCLNALNKQKCANLEIIISDDFSDDSTSQLVKDFIANSSTSDKHWKLIEAREGESTGKKSALTRAIALASGELIITTDADCTMNSMWVQSFVSCFNKTNASMITGFVRLHTGSSFLERFQALEFISLSGTGAASVILGKPLMCNGANLAFTKSAYLQAGGYSYGEKIASGDDTFLMLQIAKSGSGKVVFNKCYQSIVTSKPVPEMSQLISQRKRWASKVKFYKEGYIKATGMLLFSVNLSLLIALVFGLTGTWSWNAVALLWIIKSVSDLLFLYPLSRFAGQQQLLLLFLPAVILYPVYALTGIVISPGKVSYSWKGRDYTLSNKNNE